MTQQLREDAPAAPACTAPADDTAAAAAPYERNRWEAAVLARQLHYRTLAVALILSHHAGPGGILAQDGIQRTGRMRDLTMISSENIRQALRYLEVLGLLERLPLSAGAGRGAARGIVLTVPARRERPPHTGERP
ncbi:hypothetical protein [Streptomyces scabiei]|uniref:hypothetical protein n=1 Tax=Streptomyces scabiei TaxID=1930 RepID=UPI0038F6A673